MGKSITIDNFFKKRSIPNAVHADVGEQEQLLSSLDVNIPDIATRPPKCPRVEIKEVDITSLDRDPGLRRPILEYPIHQVDEIRRAYIKAGPYRCILSKYPKSGLTTHPRRFQKSWFDSHPSWLEYSPTQDPAFCLSCYLFSKPSGNLGQITFVTEGFRTWKKVKEGKNCAFLTHVGQHPNSNHKKSQRACDDLMNQAQHIRRVVEVHTTQQIADNRLRVKASIDVVRHLAFQGCAYRGHNEGADSMNRGNFLETLDMLGDYNEKLKAVIEKAPKYAKYTSGQIQKDILQVLSIQVKLKIREEIGDEKYCLIVDEARDESKKEQMAIVLRFVDKHGLVRERFFGLVHVSDTSAQTLKNAVFSVLSHHNLLVENIRGQGYDGASNMRGEWNGLQALVCNDCPYAYYIHCFAHRLQLALVASLREVKPVHNFFSKLTFIVNAVGASCKRTDELKAAHAADLAYKISIDELETGRGLNQIGTLQRAGDTRWSSHLRSISSLVKMFNATGKVLDSISDDGYTHIARGDAESALETLNFFDFVFILHLMKEIMEITDLLCQVLQRKSQDIVNAMHLVASTKALIQKLRDEGWDTLLSKVQTFCEEHEVAVPDMNARYVARQGRARKQQDEITIQHYYRVDIFTATIDSQLQELNNRFSEHTVQLLSLSSALDPREGYNPFKIDEMCKLAEKFYPQDFTEDEIVSLRMQLQLFEHDILTHQDLSKLRSISDLSAWLVETRKSTIYPLLDRLVRLVLTLPVSTATTERAFSAMNIIKTELRNKMDDDFLADSCIVYIEKEISKKLSINSILDDFHDKKEHRVPI